MAELGEEELAALFFCPPSYDKVGRHATEGAGPLAGNKENVRKGLFPALNNLTDYFGPIPGNMRPAALGAHLCEVKRKKLAQAGNPFDSGVGHENIDISCKLPVLSREEEAAAGRLWEISGSFNVWGSRAIKIMSRLRRVYT
ncbi:hypothetical protein B0H11DRAFT_1921695 [Mycena galericulata]|nr:hypothetical protein B0H11DRAFT_1921695 [Mycena galericulata]